MWNTPFDSVHMYFIFIVNSCAWIAFLMHGFKCGGFMHQHPFMQNSGSGLPYRPVNSEHQTVSPLKEVDRIWQSTLPALRHHDIVCHFTLNYPSNDEWCSLGSVYSSCFITLNRCVWSHSSVYNPTCEWHFNTELMWYRISLSPGGTI